MGHIFRELPPMPIPEYAHISKHDGRVYVMRRDPNIPGSPEMRFVIGKIVEDNPNYMYPNIGFRDVFTTEWEKFYGKKDTDSDTVPSYLHLGLYIVVLYIAHITGLYNLLLKIFGSVKSNAILDFVMYMLLYQSNVVQLYQNRMTYHTLFSNKLWSDSWFSNFFNSSITQNDIIKFKNEWFKSLVKDFKSKKILLCVTIDGSNIDCLSTSCALAEKGHAKSKKNRNIIGYIWVLDADTGLPLTYYVYHGSIPDCKAINAIINSFKEYGLEVDPVLLDKNFATHDVITKLDELQIPYIINLKDDNFAHNNMVNKYGNKLVWSVSNAIDDGDTTGISEEQQIFQYKKEKGYINLYYHHDDGNDRRKVYYKKILDEEKKLREKLKFGLIPTIKSEYKDFFSIVEKDGTIELEIHDKNIQDAINKKGFNSILSKKDLGAKEVSDKYSKRDASEKEYAIMKSYLGFSAARAHSTESILSKFFCCFIATIIRHFLQMVANKKLNISTNDLITTIDKIICEESLEKYVFAQSLSDKQKKILNEFGIDNDFLISITDSLNLRKNNKNYNVKNLLPDIKGSDVKFKESYLYCKNDAEDTKCTNDSVNINETKLSDQNKEIVDEQNNDKKESQEDTKLSNEDINSDKQQNGIILSNSSETKLLDNNIENVDQQDNNITENFSSIIPKSSNKRGRPLGVKNKKTLEREAELRAQGIDPNAPKEKQKRGRPLGVKNKKTLAREAELRAQGIDPNAPKEKGKPGRPLGVKNKKTLEREAALRAIVNNIQI